MLHLARVAGDTWAYPLTTLETVFTDTPARRATSRRLAPIRTHLPKVARLACRTRFDAVDRNAPVSAAGTPIYNVEATLYQYLHETSR